jgi:hypothetical protein
MTGNDNERRQQNESTLQNKDSKTTEQTANDKPTDRLKDGTNDFVNGDQEEKSESSSSGNTVSNDN